MTYRILEETREHWNSRRCAVHLHVRDGSFQSNGDDYDEEADIEVVARI